MFKWFEKRLDPYPTDEPSAAMPKGLFRFMWSCTEGSRYYFFMVMFFSAVLAVYEGFLYVFLGHVVEMLGAVQAGQGLGSEQKRVLWMIAVVMLMSIVFTAINGLVRHQVLSINLPLRLRWLFHRRMLQQTLAFFADEFAGRVTTKVMQTALAVRDLLYSTIELVLIIGVYLVTLVVLAGSFNIGLMVPFVMWIILYGVSIAYFVPRLGRVGREQADARSLMTGRITDAYSNITTVKLFSHTRREAEYARRAMEEFRSTGYRQMRLISYFEIINQTLVVLLTLSAGGYAIWLWQSGMVGIGVVASVVAMSVSINNISHWLMWQMTGLFENIGTVQDGLATLSEERRIVDAADAEQLQVTQGEVQFKNVGFGYSKDRPILSDLNLTVHAGERIGLVGRSGAGKSTLVNLLLRFYDVNAGEICIDGQNIAYVTQNSLRNAIGMVTQDTALLHRSIRENIAYGLPSATDAQVLAAAQRARADEFIQELRDEQGRTGYATMVGERGIKLSGGQRQRIAIARVMLKNAPILLLDEATSALDSEVEQAIQESLESMMEGKTVIAIAHRLSTIAAMDRLIVVDEGRVIEQGTHLELLQLGGVYANLWKHQSGGFLDAI